MKFPWQEKSEFRRISESERCRRERIRERSYFLYEQLVEEHTDGINTQTLRKFAVMSINAAVVFDEVFDEEFPA